MINQLFCQTNAPPPCIRGTRNRLFNFLSFN